MSKITPILGWSLKVVVTGGAGYIGSSLVRVLLARNIMTTSFDLDSFRVGLIRTGEARNLRQIRGDISNSRALKSSFSKGADVVVHLAGIPNPAGCDADPFRALRTNITGTDLVLRESSHYCPLFIFASSQTIYGDSGKPRVSESTPPKPGDLYSLTKLAGESMVQSYDRAGLVRGVVLRISSVYGVGAWANLEQIPGRMVVEHINNGTITLISSTNIRTPGGQVVDLIHVRDVCNAIVKVIRNPHRARGHVLNISSGRGMSVRGVAHMVDRIVCKGRKRSLRYLSGFRSTEMIRRLVLSNTQARSIIGWQPMISLQQGIQEMADYVQSRRTNQQTGLG